jgi:hypothetical protein
MAVHDAQVIADIIGGTVRFDRQPPQWPER